MRLKFLTFFLVTSSLFAQEDKTNNTFRQQECDIFNLKINEFKDILAKKKKIKVIYFFSYSCPTSNEFTPLLKHFLEQNNIEFYFVTPKNLSNEKKICNNLIYNQLSFPVYSLDKNYKNIVNLLCPSCEQKLMGYSDFFVLNDENELIFQTNYTQKSKEKLELLDGLANRFKQ